jgi:transcriptional regulator with XRE-family HTH domain
MKIGEVIARKRREKNLTQEQLAEKLGVTTSAVSKWETGSTCPDITLLAPTARALSTTVDELLCFGNEPENAEIEVYTAKARAVYEAQGFDAGWAYCQSLYREYPNSLPLKFSLGYLFQPFLILKENLTPDETRAYFISTAALYEEVLAGCAPEYTYRATMILISCYTMLKETEKAEALFNRLQPQAGPTVLSSSLYALRGDNEKALKMTRKSLLNDLAQMEQGLSLLGAYSRESNDTATALALANLSVQMASLFGLPGLLPRRDQLCSLIQAGETQSALDALQRYADAIVHFTGAASDNPLLNPQPPETTDPSFTRRVLAQTVLKDPEIAQLQNEPRYQAILLPLRELAEAPSHSFQPSSDKLKPD